MHLQASSLTCTLKLIFKKWQSDPRFFVCFLDLFYYDKILCALKMPQFDWHHFIDHMEITEMDNHIYVHTVPALSADRWFSFHLAFLRWLKLGQLKQQLINTEHPVLPRELGCQSLWLVSCASGSLFYTQPQNSLLLKSGWDRKKNRVIGKAPVPIIQI